MAPLTSARVGDQDLEPVTTIDAEASVVEALDAILESRAHAVIVVRDDVPVGLVTEGDVIRRVLADEVPGGQYLRGILASPEAAARHVVEARAAHSTRVADLMTSPLITIDADDNLQRAAAVFLQRNVRQLPVLKGGEVIGLLDRLDVVMEARRQYEQRTAGS